MRTAFWAWLLFFLVCSRADLSGAPRASSGPAADSSKAAVSDSSQTAVTLEEADWLGLGDHFLPTWLDKFPHTWSSASVQYGQPVHFVAVGFPFWSSRVDWSGLALRDPLFGLLDLNSVPLLSIGRISGGDLGELTVRQSQEISLRPFSRVYYRTGDNGLNHVDVTFERTLPAGVRFRLGADFLQYRGYFSNSEAHDQNVWLELESPLKGAARITYRLLTSALRSGHPLAVYPNYFVASFGLRRKLGQQNHLLRVDSVRVFSGVVQADFQFHRQTLDYRDYQVHFSARQALSWGGLKLSYRRKFAPGLLQLGAGLTPARAKTSGGESIAEVAGETSALWRSQLRPGLFVQASGRIQKITSGPLAASASLRIGGGQRGEIRWSLRAFHEERAVPLGYRKGWLPPFENLPWPADKLEAAPQRFSPQAVRDVYRLQGARARLIWKAAGTLLFRGDVLLGRTGGGGFAESVDSTEVVWRNLNGGSLLSVFGGISWSPLHGVGLDLRYQFVLPPQQMLPEWEEIPRHRITARLRLHRDFFQQNLHSFAFLNLKVYSVRWSYGRPEGESSFRKYRLDPVLLINLRLLFEVGDVKVFLQWQNLTNRSYELRAFQPIPGWSFHYGLLWNFWD